MYMIKRLFSVICVVSLAIGVQAQDWKDYLPNVHGTIRGKYEYQTTTDEQRFQVRNARISLDGKVHTRLKSICRTKDRSRCSMPTPVSLP